MRAARGDDVLLGGAFFGVIVTLQPRSRVLDLDAAGDLGDARHALRLACLEELDDAWQTVRDVRPATPPVWNVRMVSCVPGSPMDCAAT